jgi:DNA-binding NarL/FixJ family response regulator
MPGDLPKPSAETATQQRWRVALVDDERKIREAWAGLIQDFPDFSCVCACTSTEEALRVIPAAKPDIILMDILLPRISGIECTARLKVLLPDTPIIVLTALADDEMICLSI